MTVEQSPLDRFPKEKKNLPPSILNVEKDAAMSPTSGVIDLTNDASDKDEDLKKAIALSLKEHEKVLGGQVSMEDQDISRVIEASMAETKAGTKRKREEIWVDPLNPHDRTRNRDWPVGLKNVGNTCWFSAVIQSLFHLPVFRKLVLTYIVPKDWNVVSPNTKHRRNLVFMQELRKLFALMLCSKRKYVNPSHALEEFKEAFPDSSGTDSQQDVSEFTHKLLEWLEDAFKINLYDQNGETLMEGSDSNPMLNLFYGHYLSEGQNEGRMFSNKETFGQYPLQVNGFSNIHESLEAAMSQEIESYDVMTKSGQESWFTQIPPVLLFELSRFQFNQQMVRPEKIHNKLEFPEIMYMDRYMEPNKTITRLIREQVHKLKEKRAILLNKLEKFLNFGSGQRKVPINELLQYTLEFAESGKVLDENVTEDVEMASPASVSSTGGDSPSSNSSTKANPMEIANTPKVAVANMTGSEEFNHVNEDTVPSPHHISEMELKVLQGCLKRWRKETECSVKDLQERISDIDNTIRDIYNEPNLQQNPYRLHAVLVHEGQAASGHYWAYIYCPNRRLWLKFNDVSVTDTTWNDVQRDSMGGHHCASAYCLLYVDESKPELFEDTREIEIGPDFLYTLPEDLQQYVEDDNENFRIETENWDFEQSRKKDSSTMTVGDGDCTIIGEKRLVHHSLHYDFSRPDQRVSSNRTDLRKLQLVAPFEENGKGPFFSTLSMEHAALSKGQTIERVKQFKIEPGKKSEDAFNELIVSMMNTLKRLVRMPGADERLTHIGIYICMNSDAHDTPDLYLTYAILEQFWIPELNEIANGPLIKELAMKKLNSFRSSLNEETFAINYKRWHQEYHMFRKAVQHFVLGIEKYHNENFEVALRHFITCSHLNFELWALPGKKRGLNLKLVNHYRRMSTLKVNTILADNFERADTKSAMEALSSAFECVLPSMEFLIRKDATDSDREAAELIRNRWCSMLGEDLPSKQSLKQQNLTEFLSKLIDFSPDFLPKTRPAPTLQRISNLDDKYRAALSLANQSGELALAQTAK